MDEANQSEVARIKQQIAIEYEAASRVFTEFNAKARHAYLTACQEKLGAYLEDLAQHMSPEEAMQTFIQVQAGFVQKPHDEETTCKTSSNEPQATEPDAEMTATDDETGKTSLDKLHIAKPGVEIMISYGGPDGLSSDITS